MKKLSDANAVQKKKGLFTAGKPIHRTDGSDTNSGFSSFTSNSANHKWR